MMQSSSRTGNIFSFCHPQILYGLVDLTNGKGMKFNCTKSNTQRLITITFDMRGNLIVWSWLFPSLLYAGEGDETTRLVTVLCWESRVGEVNFHLILYTSIGEGLPCKK